MRAINTRLRRLRADQSGLSLAELLVAALLTSVMLVMVGNFFIQTAKLTTAGTQTRNSNGSAANIANEVTSVLRVATTLAKSGSEIPYPAIVSGTRSALTLYSYSLNSYSSTTASDPAPVMVTFTLNGAGTVSETRCTLVKSAGFWNPTTCAATSTRVLGSGVIAATGVADQLFTYRDGSGNPILIGTGTLSATQLDDVSSIIVTVNVQAAGSKTPPVILSNTVVLRNLGLETTP